MSNITVTSVENDSVFLGGKVEKSETLTGTVAGTSATITDTTTYPVTDQDGLTFTVTITGDPDNTGLQTVTFSGETTTAAGVAAQANAQLKGCSVAVVGTDVKITTDAVGSDISIATGAGTGAITWGSAVDGTGVNGSLVIAKGTLLARNTSTSKMVVYVASGSNGTGTPLGVLDKEETYTSTGDKTVKIARAGIVDGAKLIVSATSAEPTALEIDSLMKNSSIVAVDVVEA